MYDIIYIENKKEKKVSQLPFTWRHRLVAEDKGFSSLKPGFESPYCHHRKAKILLKSGIYTREEIAKQCGFNDVKYFYTVFKNITGFTTGKYITNQEK